MNINMNIIQRLRDGSVSLRMSTGTPSARAYTHRVPRFDIHSVSSTMEPLERYVLKLLFWNTLKMIGCPSLRNGRSLTPCHIADRIKIFRPTGARCDGNNALVTQDGGLVGLGCDGCPGRGVRLRDVVDG